MINQRNTASTGTNVTVYPKPCKHHYANLLKNQSPGHLLVRCVHCGETRMDTLPHPR